VKKPGFDANAWNALIDKAFELDSDEPFLAEMGEDEELTALGGPGSGNFGHAGRPGMIGGSTPQANAPFKDSGGGNVHSWAGGDDGISQEEIKRITGGGQNTGGQHTKTLPNESAAVVYLLGTKQNLEKAGWINNDWEPASEGDQDTGHGVSYQYEKGRLRASVTRNRLTIKVGTWVEEDDSRALGGPGSGNFGHAGRPGAIGGSAPSGGFSAASVAAQEGLDPAALAKTEARIRAEATTDAERAYADEMAVAELVAQNELVNGDTRSRHMTADGRYTEERLKLHDEITKQFFEDHQKKFGSLPPTNVAEPVVTFMAGMPGAGKSTAAMDLQKSPNVITLDPDTMKHYLPEFNGGLGSSIVQRESGDLADKLLDIAAKRRMNIVVDGTMKTSGTAAPTMGDGALGKMAAFKNAGYRVEVRFVDVDVNESITNTVTRFHQEFSRTGRGRYVPTSFSRALADAKHGTKPRASFDLARFTSFRNRPLLDAWSHTRGWTGDPKTSNFEIGREGTLTQGGSR
jgi:hypothetical protein